MQLWTAATTIALSLAAAQATQLNVYNKCGESIELYDNSATETVASGGSTTRTLATGFNGMFRNGVNSQATLAEFSITGGSLWYDISIIPTGSTGPGNCGSLEACKAVTGGTGFNTAMQIAPSGCTTITCTADGCADAYQYPSDDGKTHSCSDSAAVDLIFCPGGSATTVATTSALTTQAPTPAPTQAPTPKPTTQAPTAAPTPIPSTAAPTPVPTTATPKPTTAAPTPAPSMATPKPSTAAPTPQPTTATPKPTTAAPTPQPTTATPKPTTEVPVATEMSEPAAIEASVVSTSSFSFDGSYNSSSSSSSLDEVSAGDATIAVTPEMAATSVPSTTRSSSASDDSRTVSTRTSNSGTSTGTIVVSVLGTLVVVAAVAAVVMVRRKKQELEDMEPKDSVVSYVGILTPRTEINVLDAA